MCVELPGNFQNELGGIGCALIVYNLWLSRREQHLLFLVYITEKYVTCISCEHKMMTHGRRLHLKINLSFYRNMSGRNIILLTYRTFVFGLILL